MKKPGYILMLTLLITSIAVALLSVIVQQSFSYQRQARITTDKARARLLVSSALALVESQLSLIVEKDKGTKQSSAEGEGGPKKEQLDPTQEWLLKVLAIINRWQKVQLSGDDLEGEIRLYVAAEQGKISLSLFEDELFGEESDEQKKEAEQNPQAGKQGATGNRMPKVEAGKKSALTFFDQLVKKEHAVSIKEGLTKFVNTHRRMPEDITELISFPSFIPMKERLFMGEESKKPFYLMDLFSGKKSKGINPWLLSASLKTILGIASSKGASGDRALVKKMRGRARWEQEWDKILAPLYGKKFDALEKGFGEYLASEFEGEAFSVVSYCTVGGVTLKIYALFERSEAGEDISPKSSVFKATKLYWI